MINRIRDAIFFVFRKLIPIHKLDQAIRSERVKLYAANCVTGKDTIIHSDARIYNLQQKPKNISVGECCMIRGELMINEYGGKITIGNYSSVGENSRLWSSAEIVVGNSVHISHNVNIIDGNTHSLDPVERHNEYMQIMKEGNIKQQGNISAAPIIIEDYVWISFNASVLKGVRIGKGAVIAAETLIVEDVAPYAVMAGNPAKQIKTIQPKPY